MKKFNSNSQLKVDGKMTEQGADKVGMMQATALIIVAVACLIGSVALLMMVVR